MIAFSRRAKYPPREITKRRLSAAERALKRERDKFPLFAHEIASEQPTPQGRCEMMDKCSEDTEVIWRAQKAPRWWSLHRIFRPSPIKCNRPNRPSVFYRTLRYPTRTR